MPLMVGKEDVVFIAELVLAILFFCLGLSVHWSYDMSVIDDESHELTECFHHEGNDLCYQTWDIFGYDTGVPLLVLVRSQPFESSDLGQFEALKLSYENEKRRG